MDPLTLQIVTGVASLVAGYLLRHWFPNLAGAASTPAPIPTVPLPAIPTLPLIPALPTNGIQIGHGELLKLILAALMSPPPTPSTPATTPPVTVHS